MKWRSFFRRSGVALIVAGILALCATDVQAQAVIPGLTGTTFDLTARAGNVSGADGLSVHMWSYAETGGVFQYPGPTLIVNEGDVVTVNLTNELSEPTSILFPGQEDVTTNGGVPGLLTAEASAGGGTVSYSFVANEPGTYQYHSGTNVDLQIQMGLVGALIVRPAGFDPMSPRAYDHADSAYDHEYLFLLTETDYTLHLLVEFGLTEMVDTTTFHPVYWFINGRNAPDTMLAADVPWLPYQPYNCLPRMHPGERLLMRIVGAGQDLHPYHTHGNNGVVIAQDGRLLESTPGAGADLAYSDFTFASVPGQTLDVIFEWTGAELGWDIYGHAPDDPLEPGEYAPDHGKPFPVVLPGDQEFAFGGNYSGSPFLGVEGSIPPGQGGDNANAGYFFMWHSHNEREMVNFDIFPGGMMTMLIIEPPGVPIP